jgi:hypothetical protein
MSMFILRAFFWLSVLFLFLPGDPKTGTEAPDVSALNAFVAARAAVSDLSGMCERQPEVCSNGGAALQSFGSKARYGAQWLSNAFDGTKSADPIGAQITNAMASDGSGEGTAGNIVPTGTLTPSDAAPRWQDPAKPLHGRKV